MKKTTIIASVIAFAPVIATAQTFGEIVDAIADASPAVSVIDADGLAAEAALKGANLLEGPELEAERLYAPAGGEHRWSAGISQTLPVPGQFSRTSQAMQALRRRNLAAAEAARAEVSVSTRRLLIDYIAAKADRELTHRIALSATELLEKYRRAFEAGEATIIDLNKTRIEAARAHAADAQAEAQLEGYRAEIRAIAPDDATAEAALALTDYPPVTELPPLPQVIARYETSPKAMLAIAEADYAHATASLAATELWPRLPPPPAPPAQGAPGRRLRPRIRRGHALQRFYGLAETTRLGCPQHRPHRSATAGTVDTVRGPADPCRGNG